MHLEEISGIYRAIRRAYYLKFRQDYVTDSINRRLGSCSRCGCCAHSLIICKHFQKEGNTCALWKETGTSLPLVCKTYPFDEKDKTHYSRKHCTFYWDK